MRAIATRRACPPEISCAGAFQIVASCSRSRKLRNPCIAAIARAVGQTKAHVLRNAQMRKEVRVLRQIADRPPVQRHRRRKERKIIERNETIIGRRCAGNARENRTLARARCAEESARFAAADADCDIDGKLRARLTNLRFKHAASHAHDVVRVRAQATAAATRSSRKTTSSGITAGSPKLSRLVQIATGMPAG